MFPVAYWFKDATSKYSLLCQQDMDIEKLCSVYQYILTFQGNNTERCLDKIATIELSRGDQVLTVTFFEFNRKHLDQLPQVVAEIKKSLQNDVFFSLSHVELVIVPVEDEPTKWEQSPTFLFIKELVAGTGLQIIGNECSSGETKRIVVFGISADEQFRPRSEESVSEEDEEWRDCDLLVSPPPLKRFKRTTEDLEPLSIF